MPTPDPSPIQVAAVILYREGRVLLQHRDDKPEIAWPGHWALFGGHMEPKETAEEAAIREIEEELGLVLNPPLRLFHRELDRQRERFVFLAQLTVPLEALTQMEGQAMALLTAPELDIHPLVPAHRTILRRFFVEELGVQL